MAQILVIDDEVEYANVISESLKELNLSVDVESSAKNVLDNFDKYKNYDLILSDITMPSLSGIDLYRNIKKSHHYDKKFIMMTGYTDLISVEKAFEMGVDELLAKPFELDVLKLIINHLLEIESTDTKQDEQYFPIPIDDFLVSSFSDYYIHLKIAGKFVCVSKTGQEFIEQRLNNYKNKGIKFIYLNSKDFSKYTDMQFAISNSLKSRPLDQAKKSKVFKHFMTTLTQNVVTQNIDRELLQKSLPTLENYTNLALSNQEISNIVMNHLSESSDIVEKTALVAILSNSIAELWKWNSAKTQSRIALGVLLRDIGLNGHPELLKKKRIDLNKDELKIYEDHPYAGYRLLSEIQGIPEEVLQIVLQHHENGISSGFPQKLMKQKIHSFAKLIHGVQEFVEIIYHQDKNNKNIPGALEHMCRFQRKIVSEQVIKSLHILFKLPVPQELLMLVLPDRGGKML